MFLVPLLVFSLFFSNALSIPPPQATGSSKSVVAGGGVDSGTDGTLPSVPHSHATGLVDDNEADETAVDENGVDGDDVDGWLAASSHPQATGLVDDNGTDNGDAVDGRKAEVDLAGDDVADGEVSDAGIADGDSDGRIDKLKKKPRRKRPCKRPCHPCCRP
ncbi:hypothetical protein JVU11DRAFT_4579 [Chiua virens]|nr:hypothetical protein JVU11DRAFT_4579 [Chiua virens]